MLRRQRLKVRNDRAYRAFEREEWGIAAPLLVELGEENPEHRLAAAWWFDAALAHKFLKDWPRAFELGKVAASYVEREKHEPAYWNLGIAATVLGEWAVARDAWAGYGIGVPVEAGDTAPMLGLGMAPVRLGNGEVVWAERLCPARARVRSVPLPDSGRRFGEVVVHDGVPSGERLVDGQRFAVFDELLLLEPSELPTAEVTVEADTVADVDALIALFAQQDYGAEPAYNVEVLCACCSAGEVEQNRRDHRAGRQSVFVAAPEAERQTLLDRWQADGPRRRWEVG